MADPNIPNAQSIDLDDVLEDTGGKLRAWLRDSDRVGALPEAQAAVDVAFASGHAQGLEQGREESLDTLRTILLRWLEVRCGEVSESTMDKIAAASWATLERCLLKLASASTEQEVLQEL